MFVRRNRKIHVTNIRTPVDRSDARIKINGTAEYIGDILFEGMLYAKTLRSKRPRAVIHSVEIPPIPEGYFIVDKHDVPGKNRVKIIIDDMPFFSEDRVNYAGEPILLVVGPDRETIAHILEAITVTYSDIEPVYTIDEAKNGSAPPLFGSDNLFASYEIVKGDPIGAFSQASIRFEDIYRTGFQEHAYLEPQGTIGVYENGRVTVYGSMQCPYYVKNALIQGLGWSEDRIRVVQTTTGGAFGGKEEYPSLIAGHAAFAAIKAKRPVQLVFDRAEDVRFTTKRHPAIIRIASALDSHNRITAMDVEIKLDAGAYAGLSEVVLQRAMFCSTGVYNIPNVRVRGSAVATNNVFTGAFRGFGGPQATFAVEMHMHGLADRIGEDPLRFKRMHLIKKHDTTVTEGTIRQEVALPALIEAVTGPSDYFGKLQRFQGVKGTVRRGIGLSVFLHGCAFTGSGEKEKIRARVKLRKYRDGTVEILVSSVEMGQGPQTTLKKIVAYTLDIPLNNVVYKNPDTDEVPDSGPTVASRTVMIVGFLLQKAAEKMRESWNSAPEFELQERYEQPPFVQWDQQRFKGDAYPVYSWGANVVEVEVDSLTWEVTVKGIWAAYDIGTPMDERIIRGQIEGGISQGLGYATMEVMNSSEGRFMQESLFDYVIPTAVDLPKIHSTLIENEYEYGPFGAKCAGELPFVGAAPALASAVQHALGVPITRIPLTPDYLQEVTQGEG
jgi:CO/xanthine dehydrogenase Mo-binding subunit